MRRLFTDKIRVKPKNKVSSIPLKGYEKTKLQYFKPLASAGGIVNEVPPQEAN